MTDAERRRQRRWIDVAIDHCERRNLAEGYRLPGWIYDLIVVGQAVNGMGISPPPDPIQAHSALMDLRACYMPESKELAAPAPEQRRPCASCGQPMSSLSKQLECSGCRRLKRLVKRSAEALAS
jgi:hypothetical protein